MILPEGAGTEAGAGSGRFDCAGDYLLDYL
jgi:hypothetical protein